MILKHWGNSTLVMVLVLVPWAMPHVNNHCLGVDEGRMFFFDKIPTFRMSMSMEHQSLALLTLYGL